MYDKIKLMLVTKTFVAALPAQFKSDLQIGEIPTNLNGELDSRPSLSLFDPARFDMSYGLSMSMMSNGQNMYSLTGLTNRISYIVTNNLKFDANIILDEAHATGVIGEKGKGLAVKLNLESEIFARIHTFGKSLGCCGAAILGSKSLISYLINFAFISFTCSWR